MKINKIKNGIKVKRSKRLSRKIIGIVRLSKIEKDRKKYTRKKKHKKVLIIENS